jgi:hypothetical protein
MKKPGGKRLQKEEKPFTKHETITIASKAIRSEHRVLSA